MLALVVFGPNELPKIAAQAGRALRELRRIAVVGGRCRQRIVSFFNPHLKASG